MFNDDVIIVIRTNIYEFKKYTQKLKFVLVLKNKKTSIFYKNSNKVVNGEVIFRYNNFMTKILANFKNLR